MSHIVTLKVEVQDFEAISAACRRMKLQEPVHGKAVLFEKEVEGVIVQLPEWLYPIVCDLSEKQIKYDNYNGSWGDEKHLNRFVQLYGVEKARLEARRKGYSFEEQELEDGQIKAVIGLGSDDMAA